MTRLEIFKKPHGHVGQVKKTGRPFQAGGFEAKTCRWWKVDDEKVTEVQASFVEDQT